MFRLRRTDVMALVNNWRGRKKKKKPQAVYNNKGKMISSTSGHKSKMLLNLQTDNIESILTPTTN